MAVNPSIDIMSKSIPDMLLFKNPVDPYGGMASQPFNIQSNQQQVMQDPKQEESAVQKFLKNNILAPSLVRKEKQYDKQALLNKFEAENPQITTSAATTPAKSGTVPQFGNAAASAPMGSLPAMTNTHNYNQGMQTGQAQAMNPYAGLSFPSVDKTPYQMQVNALQKQGDVTSKAYAEQGKQNQVLGQQQQDFYAGQQTKSQENLKSYKEQTADYNAQLTKINEQFPLLNRDQIIKNMDTGKKIMSSVGMILSGVGSGMTGQKNMAFEVFNQSVDSVMQTNTQNYQRAVETLNAKRAKSLTDFEMARQSLSDNAAMQGQIFMGIKQQIDAKFQENIAPAEKYKLEVMSGQVMQGYAQLQTQTAIQGLNFQLDARKWNLSMSMNKNAVTVGVDGAGRPIVALAANEKAGDILRTELPKVESKYKAVQDILAYIDASKSKGGVKSQTLTGNALEAMKQNVALQFGLDPKTLPDIKKTFGSDSIDFYKQLLGQTQQQKDNLINVNTVR